jgi:hypothetical protein
MLLLRENFHGLSMSVPGRGASAIAVSNHAVQSEWDQHLAQLTDQLAPLYLN